MKNFTNEEFNVNSFRKVKEWISTSLCSCHMCGAKFTEDKMAKVTLYGTKLVFLICEQCYQRNIE